MIFHATTILAEVLESAKDENSNTFAGRISRINQPARLLRIRTDFANIKFLNRKDRVEFWNETYPDHKCMSLVEGRTNEYILLKVPQYDSCIRRVHFTTGTYLHFRSDDLQENVGIVKDLVKILQKKRLAMQAKKDRQEKLLATHPQRVEAVNKRFETLKAKLEIEWQKELSALEEDKSRSFMEFKNAEARVNEIDTKLEAYRVEDHNLKLDRWSLDPALYIQK